MNILVKNGNFSSVSIGERLVVPSALTAAVSAYGALSRTQLAALINLYETLRSAGLWSRLKKLYIPVIAPTRAKTHVNVLTGTVDFVPGSEFVLNSTGLTASGNGVTFTGSAIEMDSQSLTDITSFMYVSKAGNEYGGGSHNPSYGLNLSSSSDRGSMVWSEYRPDINFWTKSCTFTTRQAVTDSSSGDYTLIAGIIDADYTSVHMAGYGQYFDVTNNQNLTFDRIYPYTNTSEYKVYLDCDLQISGLMDAITQNEYNTLLSAFNTFNEAIS